MVRVVIRVKGEENPYEIETMWAGNIGGETKSKIEISGGILESPLECKAGTKYAPLIQNHNHICLTMDRELFKEMDQNRSKYLVNIF